MLSVIILASAVLCARGQGIQPWHRESATELYFYNGIDGKVQPGWTEERSEGVRVIHNVALTAEEGGPAEGLAQIEFSSANGDWRVTTKGEGYKASSTDEIVLRIRADKTDTSLTFYCGEPENSPLIEFSLQSPPRWRQIHVPLKSLKKPAVIRTCALRNDSGGVAKIFVAYMYLQVHQ